MAANTYIDIIGGKQVQKAAIASSSGAGDAGKIPALDSTGRISETMMPTGIGADCKTLPASENLSAGNVINIWNDDGTPSVRKADATSEGKEAHGFVLAAVEEGQAAIAYFEGTISGLSGLTPGATYWLHTTAGGVTASAPGSSGNIVQQVGVAISDTELSFEPGSTCKLA